MNPLDKTISMLPDNKRKGYELIISISLFKKYKYLFVNGFYKGFKVKTI